MNESSTGLPGCAALVVAVLLGSLLAWLVVTTVL